MCPRVTSNQSNPTRSMHACTQSKTVVADPPYARTGIRQHPPIPFLLYFSYNAPPYGSLILDWQDTRGTCARDNRGHRRNVTHSGLTVGAATLCGMTAGVSKCHCEITFRFDFRDDSEIYDAILSTAYLLFLVAENLRLNIITWIITANHTATI